MKTALWVEKVTRMNCAPKVGHNGIHYEEC